MAWILRSLLLLCCFPAAACSMEAAINKFSSPEDRAFAQRFVEDLRTGNEGALEREFDPELWRQSRTAVASAKGMFPLGKRSTKLVGYHVATNWTNGTSTTRKEYVLVTTDQVLWTQTDIVTLAEGGPSRVVGWRVDASKQPPPALKMYDSMGRLAPLLQAAGIVVVVALAALVWWLVRRSRRRRAAP